MFERHCDELVLPAEGLESEFDDITSRLERESWSSMQLVQSLMWKMEHSDI